MYLRNALPDDFPILHRINTASEPGVGAITAAALEQLSAKGDCVVSVNENNQPCGFVLVLEPGADYQSPNYQWFEARAVEQLSSFAYVDRIAIDQGHRGQRLGEMLYNEVFQRYAGRHPVVTCEVNSLPPNPGSMRFHQRLGFGPVGEQVFTPNEKAVVYLERHL